MCQRSTISISGGCLLKLIENESYMAQLAFDVQREDNPMKEQLVLCLLKRQRTCTYLVKRKLRVIEIQKDTTAISYYLFIEHQHP